MDNTTHLTQLTLNVKFFRSPAHEPSETDHGLGVDRWAARRRRYVVVSARGGLHHGGWTSLEAAQRFARSMPGRALAIEVPGYWHCPAWGVVRRGVSMVTVSYTDTQRYGGAKEQRVALPQLPAYLRALATLGHVVGGVA